MLDKTGYWSEESLAQGHKHRETGMKQIQISNSSFFLGNSFVVSSLLNPIVVEEKKTPTEAPL